MEQRLLEFANSLRDAGLKVSPGEIVDCLQALDAYGIDNPHLFYTLLKATLVKSETDIAVFDLAFRLYFRNKAEAPTFLIKSLCCNDGSGIDGSGMGKAGMGAASSKLYDAIAREQPETLMEMINQQLAQLQIEQHNLDHILHQVKVKMEWFMVENSFQRQGLKGKDNLQALKDLEEYLRHRIEKMVVKQHGQKGLHLMLSEENMKKKDFADLNQFQIKEMEKRIVGLANKLASRYSYRYKTAKSGRVDMRKVLQKTARMGRTPERLLFQDKVMNRPKIVVLCDISGSVSIYSAFLLQLVYAMARSFEDIRTFLFVDEIAEITPQLKNSNVNEAIYHAIREVRCSRLGISNFGVVFETFRLRFAEMLSPKTTLIILGDAKNNWFPPRQEELRIISEKAKKVIWLNPQPQNKWDEDDSIIGIYGKICSDVFECRNLEQLEHAVRRIMSK
ncbi:MAG: vWA domain-containing protein [Bacillota bacterium]